MDTAIKVCFALAIIATLILLLVPGHGILDEED